MIGKLRGTCAGVQGDCVLLDVGGVGYSVRVCAATLGDVHLMGAGPISLFIHTAVREDAIDLYGFATEEELEFFKQLVSVSGIGPKSALGILNSADVATLKASIAKGNASALTKVFGIGKKSAERIVVELKDKVVLTTAAFDIGSDADVLEALSALGYSASEVRGVLKTIDKNIVGTKERISAALQHLGSRV